VEETEPSGHNRRPPHGVEAAHARRRRTMHAAGGGLTFTRPNPPGKATRHLFVGNGGPGAGVEHADAAALFAQHGGTVLPCDQHSPSVYVTFGSEGEAAEALHGLKGKAALGQAKLSVGFAEARQAALVRSSSHLAHQHPAHLHPGTCLIMHTFNGGLMAQPGVPPHLLPFVHASRPTPASRRSARPCRPHRPLRRAPRPWISPGCT
jgi:hypothetical protein